MMKLYYTPGACSMAPHIVLTMSNAPFDLEKVDLGRHQTEHGLDFYTINPLGYVPVLELDDGTRLREAAVVVEFLAEKHPELGLLPERAGMEYYRVREWMTFITGELHKGIGVFFAPDLSEGSATMFRGKVEQRLAYVNECLADGRRYLTGDAFRITDAYLFPVLRWTGKFDISLEPYSHIQAYLERVQALPAVSATLDREG